MIVILISIDGYSESVSGETTNRSHSTGSIISGSSTIFPSSLLDPPWWGDGQRDGSITQFVSRYHPLYDKDYAPGDLALIQTGVINLAGRNGLTLRQEALDHLSALARDFEGEFSRPLVVISSYRSAKYQQWMWDLGKCSASLCAPPGSSEHQLGLAIDIFDASTVEDYEKNQLYTRYIHWMQENAHRYGWHQSYQNGETIDHYEIEPWHWRYLGTDLAGRLKRLGWTLTEYHTFEQFLDFHMHIPV